MRKKEKYKEDTRINRERQSSANTYFAEFNMGINTIISIVMIYMVFSFKSTTNGDIYLIDDVEEPRTIFHGIGAISGGGATSKLLINYPNQQRSEILDYLFKPNYGASLQILKVEIGGDAQTTDGTESSHMHTEDDLNFERGYEWLLMKEAKLRNPKIKLGALAWAFPGWVGRIPRNPYQNFTKLANYLTKWLEGARSFNLEIDYIGIWNEQQCDPDFVKYFRTYLNEHKFQTVKIIAPDIYDLKWSITKQMQKDPNLYESIDIIGEHYPGAQSTLEAITSGKVLWSSEDYSTVNDHIGAGCWARILNQNYVNGYMSATLAWNLVYSYYKGLPYGSCGLMTANTPWSGHYSVELPIWITAHTTHFTEPGWRYLSHGRGVSLLSAGGSFVSLTSPSRDELTVVIETMSWENSQCIRPDLKPYNIADYQVAQFVLGGAFYNISKLYVWITDLHPHPEDTERIVFQLQGEIEPINSMFAMTLKVDHVYTITTVNRTPYKKYPSIPEPADFPIPYFDDFESYAEHSEPYNIAPQIGVFEVHNITDSEESTQKNGVCSQVVTQTPIHWCTENKYAMTTPTAVIGDYKWSDVDVAISVKWPPGNITTKFAPVYLAAHIDKGGCNTYETGGIFFWVIPDHGKFQITQNLKRNPNITQGIVGGFDPRTWHTLAISVRGNHVHGYFDGALTFSTKFKSKKKNSGFVAFGCGEYATVYFDNLNISYASINYS